MKDQGMIIVLMDDTMVFVASKPAFDVSDQVISKPDC